MKDFRKYSEDTQVKCTECTWKNTIQYCEYIWLDRGLDGQPRDYEIYEKCCCPECESDIELANKEVVTL